MQSFSCLLIAEPSAFVSTLEAVGADLGLNMTRIETAEELLACGAQNRFELVIRDAELGITSQLQQALERLEDEGTPLLVLTSTPEDERFANDDFCDVLCKPVLDLPLLCHVALRAIERARKQKEERAYREHLEKLILERTDSLKATREKLERSRNAMKQLANQMQAALRAAPVGIAFVKNFEIQQVNRQLAEMVGLSAGKLVGMDERLLFADAATWRDAVHAIEQQITERALGCVDSQWKRHDGSLYPVELSVQFFGDSWRSGAVLCAIDLSQIQRVKPVVRKPLGLNLESAPPSIQSLPEVLLLSRDIENHFFARFMLERHGFHLSPFVDAESALICMEGVEGPMVVICDGPPRDMTQERFFEILDGRCPLYFCGEIAPASMPKDCVILQRPLDMRKVANQLIQRFCDGVPPVEVSVRA